MTHSAILFGPDRGPDPVVAPRDRESLKSDAEVPQTTFGDSVPDLAFTFDDQDA